MDYLPNAHETYGFSLLCMTWFFFVLRMGFFCTDDVNHAVSHIPAQGSQNLCMFFTLDDMGFFCTTDGFFLYYGWAAREVPRS